MGWFGTGLGGLARNVPAVQPITNVLSNLGSSNDRQDYANEYRRDEIDKREAKLEKRNKKANTFINRDNGSSLSSLYDPLYGLVEDPSLWHYGGDIVKNEVSVVNTGNTWEGEGSQYKTDFRTTNQQAPSQEAEDWWGGLSGLHRAQILNKTPQMSLSALYGARGRLDETQLGQQQAYEDAMRMGEDKLFRSGLVGGASRPSNLDISWISANEQAQDDPDRNKWDIYGPMIGKFLDASNFSFDTDSGTWRITGGPGGSGIGFGYEAYLDGKGPRNPGQGGTPNNGNGGGQIDYGGQYGDGYTGPGSGPGAGNDSGWYGPYNY